MRIAVLLFFIFISSCWSDLVGRLLVRLTHSGPSPLSTSQTRPRLFDPYHGPPPPRGLNPAGNCMKPYSAFIFNTSKIFEVEHFFQTKRFPDGENSWRIPIYVSRSRGEPRGDPPLPARAQLSRPTAHGRASLHDQTSSPRIRAVVQLTSPERRHIYFMYNFL